MKLTEQQVARAVATFTSQNYVLQRQTLGVQQWRSPRGHQVHLQLDRSPYAVFVHPGIPAAALPDVPGISLSVEDPVFNSNLNPYPKRLNRGQRPEHCGHQMLIDENQLETSVGQFLRDLDRLKLPPS